MVQPLLRHATDESDIDSYEFITKPSSTVVNSEDINGKDEMMDFELTDDEVGAEHEKQEAIGMQVVSL